MPCDVPCMPDDAKFCKQQRELQLFLQINMEEPIL